MNMALYDFNAIYSQEDYEEEAYYPAEESYEQKLIRLKKYSDPSDFPEINNEYDALELVMRNLYAREYWDYSPDEIDEALQFLCAKLNLDDVWNYCKNKAPNVVSKNMLRLVENSHKQQIQAIKDSFMRQLKRLCAEVYDCEDFDVDSLDSAISTMADECGFEMPKNRTVKLNKK